MLVCGAAWLDRGDRDRAVAAANPIAEARATELLARFPSCLL
jgi:hypothetical protein